MTFKDSLQTLAKAITSGPPFCSGTLPISSDTATLFYKQIEGETHSARWIDLSNASNDELESLAQACQPATFGLGQQDVYDESYRKAGKMDTDQFSSNLDVTAKGIVDRIHLQLLDGDYDKMNIKAQLYKLNVYGKDSFFKSHKDTPQNDTMFGSLVIVFPTPHEGGALILRHDDKEWTFDSATLTSQAAEPSIAYIAFFSDVDHEVTLVQSGHRVTLTYNLFLEETTGREELVGSVSPVAPDDQILHDALSAALADPSFLPEGGHLGFGLSFVYPVSENNGIKTSILKGSDAMIDRVCRQLSLSTTLSVYYRYDRRRRVLVPANKRFRSCTVNDNNDRGVLATLLKEHQGRFVRTINDEGEVEGNQDNKNKYINIAWVTQMPPFTAFKTPYVDQWALGNEAGSVYIYGNFCIVVEVGPSGERETAK